MSTQNFRQPEFRRETRLGLVVYGGVSLAIYMNGVCREFYNAVRGRGIYKLVKALTDSDIVVDIVSGTSAGGINGVLLSYALTNSSKEQVVDFENFAPVWRESGNIRQLMYQPALNEAANSRESLLDGAGYYQPELGKAFEQGQIKKTKAPTGEWVSSFNELDLFVTGTDILGQLSTAFDDTGCLIEVKNHRSMFHLKHRQGRKEPFNPNFTATTPAQTSQQTYQALAKLCRITSCFPVAFPVVTLKLQDSEHKEDEKLVEWGQLKNRKLPKQEPKEGYRLHFVDGGVLDNRPFSYTIKEMYYRTANRPVNRKLFYIDPSPDRFDGSKAFKEMPKPGIWQVLQDSLVGMPTYESISNDLELLKEHNERVRRYQSLLADVEAPLSLDTATSQDINVSQDIYLRSRLISLRDRVLPLILRMDQFSSTDTDKETSDKQKILGKIAQLLIRPITEQGQEEKREEVLRRASGQIRNLDVEYALRKHFYIVEKIYQLLGQEQNPVEYEKLRTLLGRLNRQIKLLEVISVSLSQLLSHPDVSQSFYQLIQQRETNTTSQYKDDQLRKEIYSRLTKLHRFLLDANGLEDFLPLEPQQVNLQKVPADFFEKLPERAEKLAEKSDQPNPDQVDWLPQTLISSIFEQFNQKIRALNGDFAKIAEIWVEARYKDNSTQNNSEEFSTILLKIEKASENLIQAQVSGLSNAEDLLNRFQQFKKLDQVVYPFEYLADIQEKELIETIRISPDDAQMGFGKGQSLDAKLAGNTLAAFGGFFKKSWRSNDILWGRLDGLNRIVEALVTRQALANFPEFIKRQAKEQGISQEGEEFEKFQEDYLSFLIDESFPNAEPSSREKIKFHLRKLTTPYPNIPNYELKDILDDLVLEGQREILRTDLQNVVQDEIFEQIEWNRQRVEPTELIDDLTDKTASESKKATKPKYELVRGYFNQTVSTLAATELASEALKSLPQGKEHFFRNEYRVGSEKLLEDLPPVVLANLATRFTLVLRDMIVTSLGDRSKALRRSLIYQVLDKSLQLFYWWLQFRGPVDFRSSAFTGKLPLIPLLQVVLLVIAIIGIGITVSKSLVWVAIALISTVLCWFLGIPWKKSKK